MRIPPLRITCVLVALALLPSLVACDLKSVTVRIADFDSHAVDGVRFHRLDERLGVFVPGGTVRFSETFIHDHWGEEFVEYTIYDADGQEVISVPVQVLRDPANPDTVTLNLLYNRVEDPGWFRVSSFNAAGESELSTEQIYL